LMLVAGAAGWLLKAKKPAHWAAQVALAIAIPVLWQIVFSTLRG